MITPTTANPAPTTSPGQSAGTCAATAACVDTGPGDLDFAGLLGAGIGRATAPANIREAGEITKDALNNASACDPAALPDTIAAGTTNLDLAGLLGTGIGRMTGLAEAGESVDVTKKADGDAHARDPAALLDAIAASAATLDAQQLTSAQIALQPIPASLAPVDPTGVQARVEDSSLLPVIVHDRAVSARLGAEAGKGTSSADLQRTGSALRAGDTRQYADATRAATVGQALALASATVPVRGIELPEHRQELFTQLPAVGSMPNHASAPSPLANTASVAAHVEQLSQPFGSSPWEDGFSSRIVWMARNAVQSAEIHLNPPDLGPIEVKMVLTNDQSAQASASIQFSAAHAATREAIESALPRLREMLLESGIALGNTTVDARTAGNTNGSGDSGRPAHGGTQPDAHTEQAPELAIQPRHGSPLRRGNGLVDTFA